MTWHLLRVELGVAAWILVLLAADLLFPPSRRASLWGVALAGIILCASLLGTLHPSASGETFQDLWLVDRFAVYFKGLFLLTAAVVIVMTREISHRLSTPLDLGLTGSTRVGAFYMLLFIALLGMLTLASINDFLLLFLGLELLTFSLYVMAAYLKTDTRSVEAGMKYLILGSVSSGFLVYGIALLYGFAGGTSFSALHAALAGGTMPRAAYAGLALALAGLGFKVAAAPFHLWVPDVYEGAPTPVVAFLSVGSKMAGVVAILRVLYGVFLPAVGWWGELLALSSAATMCYGNLAAIPQTNIKRLLGYSSIGHAGYLLMGLSTGSVMGQEAVTYYLLAYLLSNLTVFLVVTVASEAVGGDALDRYNGLSRRSPLLAAGMFLGLLSLAGVPPLAGFMGKFFVLLAASQQGRLWLVAIGAVNVAISLYYYLLVVKRMYLLAPETTAPIRVRALTKATLAVLVVGIIVVGVFQEPFVQRITALFLP